MICQSQVALEDWWHLGVEVFPPCELLQHLHGQHKDLPQPFLLQEEVARDSISCNGTFKDKLKTREAVESKPGTDACSYHETPCSGRCCWSYWSWKTRSAERSGWSRPGFAAAERCLITGFKSKNYLFSINRVNNVVMEVFQVHWSRFWRHGLPLKRATMCHLIQTHC